MKCPICRKEVVLGEGYAPFCSERCKLIDLGNWASEKYVMSTPLKQPEANASTDTQMGEAETDEE